MKRIKEYVAVAFYLDVLLICLILNNSGYAEKISRMYDSVITSSIAEVAEETGKGKIALTFDDGPLPGYTDQLLDGLKERNVKVTFFVTGKNASAYQELVKRMYKEGHLIGNHTYSHLQYSQNNEEKFKQELLQTNEVLYDITGENTAYVRPPFGSWDKKFEKELNMFPVMWTVDPLDWCKSNSASIVQKVIKDTEENDIILMHDQYQSSVNAALQIVDILKEKGFEFVTVEEILFD